MKVKFDLSDFLPVPTVGKTTEKLVERFKKRRKELGFSQKQLSIQSGVSYSSIKRFEQLGEISLSSLMKLADTIDCLGDFDALFKNAKISSLKEL